MNRQPIITEAVTRDLILQIANGNEEALQRLCQAYEKPLLRVALNIVGNRETAVEVMQDVLLAIWEGAKSFRGDSKPLTWMWSIVRFKAIAARRRSVRSCAFQQPAADTFKEKPELDAVICEALRRLSPEHRIVVILTYYFGFSQYHIGRLMLCPVGTVKSRLSAALRTLKEIWKAPPKLGRIGPNSTVNDRAFS
jgi:RNA polymerase sigma-70 factor (ECF subfamily)